MCHCLLLAPYVRAHVIMLALATLVAALLVACGGGEETPAARGTPPEGILPVGTPAITDSQFDFPARGYAVQIPEGWTVDASFLTGPNFATDAFFAPGPEEAGAKANIAVTLETVEAGLTTESYSDLKIEFIQQLAQDEPRVSSREVAAVEAAVVEYEPTTTGVRVEKTDVMFVQGTYAWTVTLTVPAGQRAKYEDIFDRFLTSFRTLQ